MSSFPRPHIFPLMTVFHFTILLVFIPLDVGAIRGLPQYRSFAKSFGLPPWLIIQVVLLNISMLLLLLKYESSKQHVILPHCTHCFCLRDAWLLLFSAPTILCCGLEVISLLGLAASTCSVVYFEPNFGRIESKRICHVNIIDMIVDYQIIQS